jgi:hypothetical protein
VVVDGVSERVAAEALLPALGRLGALLCAARPWLVVLALTGVREQAEPWQLVPRHEELGGVSRGLLAAARERTEWSWMA